MAKMQRLTSSMKSIIREDAYFSERDTHLRAIYKRSGAGRLPGRDSPGHFLKRVAGRDAVRKEREIEREST